MIEEIILCLLILFKYMYEKGRGFEHTGQKRSVFHSLIRLLHILCFWCIHTCAHTRLSQTTTILFIKSGTTIINHTILSWLVRVKNVHGNQLSPPLNHLWILACEHVEFFILRVWPRKKETNEIQNILLHPGRLTIRSLREKAINNRHYLY